MKTVYARMGALMIAALLVMFSFGGCAKPPTQEMSDAKLAFQEATDAGAQTYASEQFLSSEDVLY